MGGWSGAEVEIVQQILHLGREGLQQKYGWGALAPTDTPEAQQAIAPMRVTLV